MDKKMEQITIKRKNPINWEFRDHNQATAAAGKIKKATGLDVKVDGCTVSIGEATQDQINQAESIVSDLGGWPTPIYDDVEPRNS